MKTYNTIALKVPETLENLDAAIAELNQIRGNLFAAKRASIILMINEQIQIYGITLNDLKDSFANVESSKRAFSQHTGLNSKAVQAFTEQITSLNEEKQDLLKKVASLQKHIKELNYPIQRHPAMFPGFPQNQKLSFPSFDGMMPNRTIFNIDSFMKANEQILLKWDDLKKFSILEGLSNFSVLKAFRTIAFKKTLGKIVRNNNIYTCFLYSGKTLDDVEQEFVTIGYDIAQKIHIDFLNDGKQIHYPDFAEIKINSEFSFDNNGYPYLCLHKVSQHEKNYLHFYNIQQFLITDGPDMENNHYAKIIISNREHITEIYCAKINIQQYELLMKNSALNELFHHVNINILKI